jgi:hypothetical protein
LQNAAGPVLELQTTPYGAQAKCRVSLLLSNAGAVILNAAYQAIVLGALSPQDISPYDYIAAAAAVSQSPVLDGIFYEWLKQ